MAVHGASRRRTRCRSRPGVDTEGVVRPPGAETGILLTRADGPDQERVVGDQVAGRVGFFLRVDDFQATYERLLSAGVDFVKPPRDEDYGRIAVFTDIAGNRWDLLGPT